MLVLNSLRRAIQSVIDRVFCNLTIKVQPLVPVDQFKSLVRATAGSTCLDAMYLGAQTFCIQGKSRVLIPLGFKAAIPLGWEAQIRSRSGLAINKGITIFHGIGSIDADFRGEWCAIVFNHNDTPFWIQPGDKICQIAFAKVPKVKLQIVDQLDETARAEGGFGSTGR